MDDMIGRIINISGMTIEVVGEDGDRWQTRNLTTQETVCFDKAMLDKAIRLGMAEVISESRGNEETT